jgi:hypothetical protein
MFCDVPDVWFEELVKEIAATTETKEISNLVSPFISILR